MRGREIRLRDEIISRDFSRSIFRLSKTAGLLNGIKSRSSSRENASRANRIKIHEYETRLHLGTRSSPLLSLSLSLSLSLNGIYDRRIQECRVVLVFLNDTHARCTLAETRRSSSGPPAVLGSIIVSARLVARRTVHRL